MEHQQAFQELALAFGRRPGLKPRHLSKILEHHGGDGPESAAFILSCRDMDPEEMLKNLSNRELDEKEGSNGQEEESTEEEEVTSAEEAGVSAAAAKAPDAQAGKQTDDEELKSRLKRSAMGRSQRRISRNSQRNDTSNSAAASKAPDAQAGNQTDDEELKSRLRLKRSTMGSSQRHIPRNSAAAAKAPDAQADEQTDDEELKSRLKRSTMGRSQRRISRNIQRNDTSKPTPPLTRGGSSSTSVRIDKPGAQLVCGSNTRNHESDAVMMRYDSEFDLYAGSGGPATLGPTAVPVLIATLVHEESSKIFVTASVTNEKEDRFWLDRRCWLFAIGLLVAGGVAAGLVMSKAGDDANDQAVSQQYDELLDLLSANSPDGGTSLFDPASVQFKAFAWLHKDPSLESYSDSQKLTRYVLATFFTAAGGSDWKNNEGWLDYAESECNWYGVQCQNVVDGSVAELILASNNVNGQLVKELSLLSDLVELQLFDNKLAGFVPKELGLLSKLEWLFVDENDFIGIMPSEICDLMAEDTGALSRLEADCPEEMVCSCCTKCCSDGIGCVDI